MSNSYHWLKQWSCKTVCLFKPTYGTQMVLDPNQTNHRQMNIGPVYTVSQKNPDPFVPCR